DRRSRTRHAVDGELRGSFLSPFKSSRAPRAFFRRMHYQEAVATNRNEGWLSSVSLGFIQNCFRRAKPVLDVRKGQTRALYWGVVGVGSCYGSHGWEVPHAPAATRWGNAVGILFGHSASGRGPRFPLPRVPVYGCWLGGVLCALSSLVWFWVRFCCLP